MKKLVAIALLLTVVTGCSFGIPRASARPAPRITIPQAFTVGVDLNVNRPYTPAQIASWGRRDIAYMADVLHVQAVGIDFDLVSPYQGSDQMKATDYATPTVADIETLTRIAQSYHLEVEYRVLYWLSAGERSIHPAHAPAFFANLLTAESPYLRLAQHYDVGQFIAGTEWASLEEEPEWNWFLAHAAQIYHGVLTYAMWGGEPGQGGVFWGQGCDMPIALCGVTFYPDDTLPPTASVAQVTTAWEATLTRLPASTLENLEIDEVGIPAIAGAYRQPWNWSQTGRLDATVQATWFTAACAAAHAERLRGLWFWTMPINDDPSSASASPTLFAGRPGSVAAIQACAQSARSSSTRS
jgi:hypothetical protein